MGRVIEFFAKNSLVVKIFVLITFLLGFMALRSLEREAFPKVDYSMMVVQTSYPGASPLDVELNVTKKIEEELDEVDGLEKYTSTSAENFSNIVIWIDINEQDTDGIKDDIQKAVDRAQAKFPGKVQRSEVTELKTKNIPIIRYVVSSEKLSEEVLRKIARNLEEKIEALPGVSKVEKLAYRDPEIKVLGDLAKMEYKNISFQDMAAAIQNYNVRLGGGSIESSRQDRSIVTVSEFKSLQEVKDVIIRSNFSNMQVRIGDVAEVVSGYSDREIYARGNQNIGIVLEVLKREGKDIIKTVDQIRQVVSEYEKLMDAEYGDSVKFVPIGDISRNTRKLLNASFSNAWQGVLLVFFILLIFIDFKSAFWVSFGIPFSLMIAFIGMYAFGFTINNIALFGIIIVLGMLVDNQVVVAENIHQKREQGLRGVHHVMLAAVEVFSPVLSSTLTTVMAFIPLAFMSGIMGKFIYQLPIVVILALGGSLIEAFLILPSTLRKDPKERVNQKKEKKSEERKWFLPVQHGFEKVLRFCLRFRYAVVLFFVVLFFFSLFLASKMDFILFSSKDNDTINIMLEGPEGISLDEMFRRTKAVESKVVQEVPYRDELGSMVAMVGTNRFGVMEVGTEAKNRALIRLFLVPYDDRTRTAGEVAAKLRKILQDNEKDFKKLQVMEVQGGPPVGKPVELKVISNDDHLRQVFSDKIEAFIREQAGVYAFEKDSDNQKEEVRLKLDINKMYQLGVNPLVVASTIRTAYKGDAVSSIVTQDEDIDIVVQVAPEYKKTLSSLENILIPSSYKKQIKLSSIGTFRVETNQPTIIRYNGKRTTTLAAELDKSKNTPSRIMTAIYAKFKPDLEKYPEVEISTGGEAEKTAESISSGARAFLLALVGIYLILLLQFKTVSQPLLVLSTLPFGFIGLILAFKAHGEPFGFMAIIGWVGLAGVIVNNAIILIDIINRMKAEKNLENRAEHREDVVNEIIRGTSSRLRPILLTTMTTMLGLIPSIYGWGGTVFILRPVTMALAYGLFFGMFLTLILIPAFYMIDYDFKLLVHRMRSFVSRIFKKQINPDV